MKKLLLTVGVIVITLLIATCSSRQVYIDATEASKDLREGMTEAEVLQVIGVSPTYRADVGPMVGYSYTDKESGGDFRLRFERGGLNSAELRIKNPNGRKSVRKIPLLKSAQPN